jgi:hypothetical protein
MALCAPELSNSGRIMVEKDDQQHAGGDFFAEMFRIA